MASIDESLDEARIIERALLRIKAIGLAKGVDGHVQVWPCYWIHRRSPRLWSLSNDQWERLLVLAEQTQESHPRSNGSIDGNA